jgi:hypothetical protein
VSLADKQMRFAQMVGLLLQKAPQMGYQVTLGDAYRDPRVPYGHDKSLHRVRLAIDLNVFRDGKYLTTGGEYTDLGEYWESLGGTWGGRFNDGNHFSLAHGGMK